MLRGIIIVLLTIGVVGTGYWGYKEHQEKNAVLIRAENSYQRAFHDLAYEVDLLHDKINLRETVPQTNVTFTGYLQGGDLAEAYACSNIMVFPSATETFGNVVLESLACGTPVIGANSGGVKNIITDGKTGVLCPPKNEDAFLSSIYSLLQNEEQLIQMGIAASSYAKTKSWDEIFRGLLDQYEEVLQHTASELLA